MRVLVFLMMLVMIPLVTAVPMSFSDQGTGLTLSGVEVASGDLGITIWDSATGGNVLYAENFSQAIVNGSWNVIMNDSLLELEFGVQYWKDYTVNGTDLDFDGEERISLYSSLGLINNQSFVNGSNVGGWETNTTRTWTNQSVGIGIEAPTQALAVRGHMLLEFSEPSIYFNQDDGNASVINYDEDWDAMTFRVGQAGSSFSRMVITENGSVGIGDNFPDAVLELSNNGGSDDLFMASSDDNNDGDLFIIDGGGNVGIGTTTPDKVVTIYNGTTNRKVGIDDSGLYFSRTADGAYSGTIIADAGGNLDYSVRSFHTFDVNTVSELVVGEGSVGVRTSSGSERLTVNGNASFNNTLFVLENGRVGIGTSSPTYELEIQGETSPQLEIEDTTNNARGFFQTQDSGSRIGTATAHPLLFVTGLVNQATLTAAGNFGLGIAAPATKLHVNGSINVTQDEDVCITGGNCLSAAGGLWTNSSGNATYVGGRVGIGTSPTQAKLHVRTEGSLAPARFETVGTNGYVVLQTNNSGHAGITINTGDADRAAGIAFANSAEGDERWSLGRYEDGSFAISQTSSSSGAGFYNNAPVKIENATPANTLVIDANGNIGLSETTPASILHLTGQSPTITVNDTGAANGTTVNVVGLDQSVDTLFRIQDEGVTEISLLKDGTFGLGNASTHYWSNGELHTYYFYGANGDASTPTFRFINDPDTGMGLAGTNAIRFITGGSTQATLDSSGNLGVGTTTPATALDINGTIRISNIDADNKIRFLRTGGNTFSIEHDTSRLYFYNGSEGGLAIDNINRVGIGTISPSARLHVDGTVRLEDFTSCTALETDGSGNLVCGTDDVNGTGGSLWTNSSGNATYVSGNVGIGTTAPEEMLHIDSNTDARVYIDAGNAGGGTPSSNTRLLIEDNTVVYMEFLTPNNIAPGIIFSDEDASDRGSVTYVHGTDTLYLESAGNLTLRNVGGDRIVLDESGDVHIDEDTLFVDIGSNFVGIETNTPARPLHINDVMRLEPRSSAPSSPGEGDIYFDSDEHKPCYYNSTDWVTFDDSATCS
ncbi:MAG: hypothetical protein OXR66_08265 [Candidatus Woesearchaeota archaeon]|nr:hypothetical protein [Candidatus Woesearchaeota archaeon]